MVHLPKSQPAPECLAIEAAKANGNYNCGTVLTRIQTDFKNKCYICEYKEPITINTEHFIPHRGNTILKFSWENLFYACGHCNNVKSDNVVFDHILNCTNSEDEVDKKIIYRIRPYPRELAEFTSNEENEKVSNTIKLLNSVFNGTTKLKQLESANLRSALLKEIRRFQELLFRFVDDGYNDEERECFKREIIKELRSSSNFTAFKLWILRENDALRDDFVDYL